MRQIGGTTAPNVQQVLKLQMMICLNLPSHYSRNDIGECKCSNNSELCIYFNMHPHDSQVITWSTTM
jgi:hypothetical protein